MLQFNSNRFFFSAHFTYIYSILSPHICSYICIYIFVLCISYNIQNFCIFTFSLVRSIPYIAIYYHYPQDTKLKFENKTCFVFSLLLKIFKFYFEIIFFFRNSPLNLKQQLFVTYEWSNYFAVYAHIRLTIGQKEMRMII